MIRALQSGSAPGIDGAPSLARNRTGASASQSGGTVDADQKPYLDFDLQIEKIGRRYRARATTPFGGVSTVDFSRPFTPDHVKLLLLRVGRTRLTTRATPGRVPVEEIGTVEAFGRRLYEKVFTGDVR